MSFSLGTLTAYTEQNAANLITKSVLGARSIGMATVMPNIKSAETINIMATDAVIQAGGSCGFNSSGTTSITQRTLTVGKLKVQESLCPPDLEAYYTQKALTAGSNYDSIAYAKDYTDLKIKKINAAMEIGVWQFTTGGGDQFDGWLKWINTPATGIIEANSTTYGLSAVLTAFTNANTLSAFQAINAAIPVEIIDASDLQVMCGWDVFRKLIANITNLNFFSYIASTEAATKGELIIPGTNLKVYAVNGLNSQDTIVACQKSNLYFGTDLMDEWESKFSFKYDEINEVMKFSAKWKAGTQIAFPDQVVAFRIPPGS